MSPGHFSFFLLLSPLALRLLSEHNQPPFVMAMISGLQAGEAPFAADAPLGGTELQDVEKVLAQDAALLCSWMSVSWQQRIVRAARVLVKLLDQVAYWSGVVRSALSCLRQLHCSCRSSVGRHVAAASAKVSQHSNTTKEKR